MSHHLIKRVRKYINIYIGYIDGRDMRKRAICPRCGWTARLVEERCFSDRCIEKYICTRCLYEFTIEVKK
jgi:transposase-like protein